MATAVIAQCLDLTLEARLDEAAALAAAELAVTADPAVSARLAALAAVTEILRGRHVAARRLSALATQFASDCDDPAACDYATAVSMFVECLSPPADEPLDLRPLRGWPDEVDDEDASVFGYLAIEACMSAGRLVDAEDLAIAYFSEPRLASVQAPIFARIAWARSLVFQGRVAEAKQVGDEASVQATARGGAPARMLAAATLAYIAAQCEDRDTVERLTTQIVAIEPHPTNYMSVGAHVLCAYGLGAVGSTSRAATMLLEAGGGRALPRLQTVDRAYAYELLASEAIERDDLTAARAWGRRAAPLEIHDMAAAAVERTLSRIDVAMGRTASGAERAAVSAARALVAGGRLDATRSRILEASALAATGARGAAVTGLRGAADEADSLGAVAVRNWSARELRRLGRRLRPAAGSGWQALSSREQQIALLAAEGYSNRMIGQALYLSDRTVQSHLSRALAALGATSRAAIPASLGRERPQGASLDGLTTRQQQVAALVADGCSNRAISESLGISDKTVEKHVQAIFARWHVSSRTGIANRVLSPLPIPAGRSA